MSSKPSTVGYRTTLEASVNQFCDSLAVIAKRLADCSRRLRRGGSLTATSQRLADVSVVLAGIKGLNDEAQQLTKQCEEAEERNFLEVESHLRDICGKRGWRLDGQWPDFIVDYGLSVHVDEVKRSVSIEGATALLDQVEANLAERAMGLLPKKFSPDEFMKKLVEAYDAVAKAKSPNIPILELYRELVILTQSPRFWRDASSSSFNPLTIAQFRAQFSRMLEAGLSAAPDGRELRLLPPLDPRDAVFIYQPAERRFGFVGRVELSRF